MNNTLTVNDIEDHTLYDLHLLWDTEHPQEDYLKHVATILNSVLDFTTFLATRLTIDACKNGKTLIFTSPNKDDVITVRDLLVKHEIYCEITPIETNNKKGL